MKIQQPCDLKETTPPTRDHHHHQCSKRRECVQLKEALRHRAVLRRHQRLLVRAVLSMLPLFCLFFSLPARASTIIGNIRNTSGNAYATNALFTPLSTPQTDGTTVIASTQTNVMAAADGSFSVLLKQGNYKVNIGNLPSDTFLISVPNDSATYNITALITSEITYAYPVSPIYEEKINKGMANGYATLDSSGLVAVAQLGPGAANGYFLRTDGLNPSWQPPPASYGFDDAQFTIANNTNVVMKKAASLTNIVLYANGIGPALGLAAGAGIILTNGNLLVKSNGIVTIGDATGSAQIRFQAGAFASDYTGSEQWNFKTAAAGGRDAATVARIADLTNGLVIATQDGFGTNTTVYAAVTTNIPLSIVGTATHATNHLEIRNGSGVIIGYVATNGVYRSQYDFLAQFTSTDNTTNTVYAFTPGNNSAVRVHAQAVAWNSTGSSSYGRIGTFKNVSGTVTQVGGVAALGVAEDDAAYEALLDTASNQIRVRVAGNTGRTVNWTIYGTIFYAP